jgi:hypothetical protein
MRLAAPLVPLLAALLIAACSKVTQENFAKLLGTPTESNSVNVNGKVALKTYDKTKRAP